MASRMIRVALVVLSLTVVAGSAHAFGVYADAPVNFKFSDCTQDCSYTPSGLKAGIIMPGNVGLGFTNFKVSVTNGPEVEYNLYDLSYLLPLPIINISVGVGFGGVDLTYPGSSASDDASHIWASFGVPVIPLLDLHIGYHQVNASVTQNQVTTSLDGTLWTVGAMLFF